MPPNPRGQYQSDVIVLLIQQLSDSLSVGGMFSQAPAPSNEPHAGRTTSEPVQHSHSSAPGTPLATPQLVTGKLGIFSKQSVEEKVSAAETFVSFQDRELMLFLCDVPLY